MSYPNTTELSQNIFATPLFAEGMGLDQTPYPPDVASNSDPKPEPVDGKLYNMLLDDLIVDDYWLLHETGAQRPPTPPQPSPPLGDISPHLLEDSSSQEENDGLEPLVVGVPPSATPNLPPSATPNLPPSAMLNLPPFATPNLPPSATLNLPPSATLNLPPSATLNLPPSATLNLRSDYPALSLPEKSSDLDDRGSTSITADSDEGVPDEQTSMPMRTKRKMMSAAREHRRIFFGNRISEERPDDNINNMEWNGSWSGPSFEAAGGQCPCNRCSPRAPTHPYYRPSRHSQQEIHRIFSLGLFADH
ncbi:hypothetical protein C8R44DRAFT_302513 [Mycena epipterygia]|nr:hypothetical protein C8R44DRAFT_302513 [Mycena epipterygia]